jgi:hypothetical protein
MRRTSLVIMAAALGALALVLTASGVASAASHAKTHTLKFTSVQTASKNFGNHFADADKDVSKGKVIGYDVVSGVYHPKTQSFTFNFAASLKGGILYGKGTGSGSTGKLTGTLTGGTGKFKGARGTVNGQATGKHDQNEKLVIVWH